MPDWNKARHGGAAHACSAGGERRGTPLLALLSSLCPLGCRASTCKRLQASCVNACLAQAALHSKFGRIVMQALHAGNATSQLTALELPWMVKGVKGKACPHGM